MTGPTARPSGWSGRDYEALRRGVLATGALATFFGVLTFAGARLAGALAPTALLRAAGLAVPD